MGGHNLHQLCHEERLEVGNSLGPQAARLAFPGVPLEHEKTAPRRFVGVESQERQNLSTEGRGGSQEGSGDE